MKHDETMVICRSLAPQRAIPWYIVVHRASGCTAKSNQNRRRCHPDTTDQHRSTQVDCAIKNMCKPSSKPIDNVKLDNVGWIGPSNFDCFDCFDEKQVFTLQSSSKNGCGGPLGIWPKLRSSLPKSEPWGVQKLHRGPGDPGTHRPTFWATRVTCDIFSFVHPTTPRDHPGMGACFLRCTKRLVASTLRDATRVDQWPVTSDRLSIAIWRPRTWLEYHEMIWQMLPKCWSAPSLEEETYFIRIQNLLLHKCQVESFIPKHSMIACATQAMPGLGPGGFGFYEKHGFKRLSPRSEFHL